MLVCRISTVAFGEVAAQLFDRPLDPSGDLARLLVADRLRKLRARVRQRSQRIPTRDDMLCRARDGIQRVAQLRGGCFEIFGEDHFLFFARREQVLARLARWMRLPAGGATAGSLERLTAVAGPALVIAGAGIPAGAAQAGGARRALAGRVAEAQAVALVPLPGDHVVVGLEAVVAVVIGRQGAGGLAVGELGAG